MFKEADTQSRREALSLLLVREAAYITSTRDSLTSLTGFLSCQNLKHCMCPNKVE